MSWRQKTTRSGDVHNAWGVGDAGLAEAADGADEDLIGAEGDGEAILGGGEAVGGAHENARAPALRVRILKVHLRGARALRKGQPFRRMPVRSKWKCRMKRSTHLNLACGVRVADQDAAPRKGNVTTKVAR